MRINTRALRHVLSLHVTDQQFWAFDRTDDVSGSLNPSIALKANAYLRCFFSPPEEHHAFRWASSADPAVDFADRKFLPDTLKKIT